MKILLFILSFSLLVSCNVGDPKLDKSIENNSETTLNSSKSELSNILVYFLKSEPKEGNWNRDFSNEKIEKLDCEVLKDDKIFWCYDVSSLVKIDILGNIENAKISFKNNGSDQEKIILENQDIMGSYSIVPITSNGGLMGGEILIYSNNELIKRVQIEYEGCL